MELAGRSRAAHAESGWAGLAVGSYSIQDCLERVAALSCGSSEGLVARFTAEGFSAGVGVILGDEVSVHGSLPFSSRTVPRSWVQYRRSRGFARHPNGLFHAKCDDRATKLFG
jgi:hypothetical protein